jgi:hypothetical protein
VGLRNAPYPPRNLSRVPGDVPITHCDQRWTQAAARRGAPEVLWVDAKAPGDRTATVEALYRGLAVAGAGPCPRRLADAA